MLHLRNDELTIDVLDPVADRARFGVRYCTGGYVFQVHDKQRGELLSGPTYPASFNWFDGQGIPDAFNLGPLTSTKTTGEALIVGIGVCDLVARKVKTFDEWRVTTGATELAFTMTQRYEQHALSLERKVSLAGRTVRSWTSLTNLAEGMLPIRWFPHPFYPQTATDDLLWVNAPLAWKDGEHGYGLERNGFIARRGWPWAEGKYLPLDHEATAPLVLLQRHPKLGLVGASLSYVPDYFPIWGNPQTFSWEPFLERTVGPAQSLAWWIDYSF
jgi:hypothetical protein